MAKRLYAFHPSPPPPHTAAPPPYQPPLPTNPRPHQHAHMLPHALQEEQEQHRQHHYEKQGDRTLKPEKVQPFCQSQHTDSITTRNKETELLSQQKSSHFVSHSSQTKGVKLHKKLERFETVHFIHQSQLNQWLA